MSGVCGSTFFSHPPGAPGSVQRSTIRFEKSISKILYQTLCLFSKIKDKWDFHYVAWVILQGVGLGAACGSFFSKHGRVAYQIEGDGEQTGNKLNVHPMVKLVTLRYSQ